MSTGAQSCPGSCRLPRTPQHLSHHKHGRTSNLPTTRQVNDQLTITYEKSAENSHQLWREAVLPPDLVRVNDKDLTPTPKLYCLSKND
ncbi:hypothetical protein J6590_043537 [Homalodisca vitripennis]|nr:hypothetical protein J6590_043537 [Homalodisca vitripennis]